jgi:hypothetical protein
MDIVNVINVGIANYYGSVMAFQNQEDGKYYLGLDDYNDMSIVEISEKLYLDIENEFKTSS